MGGESERVNTLLKLSEAKETEVSIHHSKAILKLQCPVRVKLTADSRGRGLFAARAIQSDQLVFSEPPLVAEQHLRNKTTCTVCSHCFCFLGSLESQAAHLLGRRNDIPQAYITRLISEEKVFVSRDQFAEKIPCQLEGCSNFYCSKECLTLDWESHHSLLCPGSISNRHPRRQQLLQEFQDHAEATNEIFLLAQKVVARILLSAQRQLKAGTHTHESALETAWLPFAAAWKAAWWDCIATPHDVEDETAFRADLKQLAEDSFHILKELLDDGQFPSLFDLEVYGNIIGMFELNNLGLFVPHPLLSYMDDLLESSCSGSLEDHGFQGKLLPFIEQALEEIQGCEGTAFYTIQSCMNHSCSPNVSTSKGNADTDGKAVLTAVKDVNEGEELTISYVDEQLPFPERQDALRDYGFVCHCEKCELDSKVCAVSDCPKDN